jgi:YidC/Oxa1 family membrane protein insertase
MQAEDTRNLILAIVIVMAMMLGYELLFAQRIAPQPDSRTEQNIEARTDGAPPAAAGQPAAPGAAADGRLELGIREDRATALGRAPRVRIDTPRLSGSLRVTGGRLDDLTLLGYRQTVEKDSPDVVLLSPSRSEHPYFVDFRWLGESGVSADLPGPETPWQASGDRLAPGKPVTLRWDNGKGLVFARTFSVDENYLFTVLDRVENRSGAPVALSPEASVTRVGTPPSVDTMQIHEGPVGVLARGDGDTGPELKHASYDFLRDTAREAEVQPVVVSQQFGGTQGGWLGITDKYWLVAVVPDKARDFQGKFRYQRQQGRDVYKTLAPAVPTTVEPGGALEARTMLFAGAKESRVLADYEEAHGITLFDRAIDWGWIPFLAKPVFWLLEWLKTYLGNFGLAILAITVIIKLAFFSLANKSYVAMGKMRKLTPKMTAIRERWKDDPVKQREEMMKLYQTEKVNPLAGCLPILVQIPVFIALYQVLMASIEMRHAPFYGWVKDMSALDPWLITNLFGLIPWTPPAFLSIGIWTLLMGATMYVQQQLNPPPPDPVQAKVFKYLPILFIFLFASFPVGLVIYWTWNNLLTIAQQWLIMKRHGAFDEKA